jgi:hypothetical protein
MKHFYVRIEKRKNDINGNPRDRMWICKIDKDGGLLALNDKPEDVGYRSDSQAALEWISDHVKGCGRFPAKFVPPANMHFEGKDRRILRTSSGSYYNYAGWLNRYEDRKLALHFIS